MCHWLTFRDKNELIIEKDDSSERLALANEEVKKMKKEIHDNKEELRQMSEVSTPYTILIFKELQHIMIINFAMHRHVGELWYE